MTKKTCPLGEDCDLTAAWMAGRESAKDEAKARIEELEADLRKMALDYLAAQWQASENFQMYVDANEARIDAETSLAKALEALEGWINVYTHCTIEEGVCCCGDDMKNHTKQHMPMDHGAYIAGGLAEQTETTLAELKGEDWE